MVRAGPDGYPGRRIGGVGYEDERYAEQFDVLPKL